MKNLVIPNYDRCLMNITSTILKHYGVNNPYKSIDILEKELKKQYRNVVLILVDAMGSEILKKHPKESEFLIANQKEVITTVFPSTTVSATTSVLTGKPPMVNGWVGWLQYIKEEDRSVIFFFNKDFYDEAYEFDYNVSEKYAPVKKVYEQIQENNDDVKTIEIFPEFRTPEHKKFRDICNSIVKSTEEEGKHFIYAYWDKVDTYLHHSGTTSDIVKNHLAEINEDVKYLVDTLNDDTLIIITADHGQIDIEELPLWENQKIVETFKHNPSIEARATAFFIKEGMEEQFHSEFIKSYGEYFILYKSSDLLKTHYLGYGEEQYKLKEFLGDYFSIAIDKYSFKLSDSKRSFKAQHAGLTKDEMLIPLIIFSQKK